MAMTVDWDPISNFAIAVQFMVEGLAAIFPGWFAPGP